MDEPERKKTGDVHTEAISGENRLLMMPSFLQRQQKPAEGEIGGEGGGREHLFMLEEL